MSELKVLALERYVKYLLKLKFVKDVPQESQ